MGFQIDENHVLQKYINEPGKSKIVVPDNVKVIGINAFHSCRTLESITLPDTVEEIEFGPFGETPFQGCVNLKEIAKLNQI